MCPREDIDYQGSQLQELKSELESKLVEVSRSLEEKLDAVLTKLGDKAMK